MLSLSKYLKASKLIVCLLLFKSTFGQNLIRNSSFENYHTPISWNLWGGDFIGYYSNPADTVMIDWKEYQTPDFLISACTHTYSGVPTNLFGYSNPKSGNGYIGLVVYARGGYDKEYAYQQLSQPLQAGKIYCLSFYVNRADRFTYAIKSIGALFTNNLSPTTNIFEINATPQVVNTGGFITDTTQWTQIQGCFTAVGGEQYITIGNFTTNYNTDTLNTNSTNLVPGREGTSYYYIDDITLIDQTTVGVNELSSGNSFEVYPNPTNAICTISSKSIIQKIELTNIAGQLLLQETINSKTHQLQLNNFSQGIYFVKVNYPSGLSVTKKIIVNQ